MRTTKEHLLKLAKDAVDERTEGNNKFVAAFLIGSTLGGDPFLNGAADIDLLFITKDEPYHSREIERITDDIHLDMIFEPHKLYERPRELRVDPWRGYALYDLMPLYETRHFFEFTQAGVRSQFDSPINRAARIRSQLTPARRLWAQAQSAAMIDHEERVQFLNAIHHAVNAIALFSGSPLPGRRMIEFFPDRAREFGHPELTGTLIELINGTEIDAAGLISFLPSWQDSFRTASAENAVDDLHEARLNYYAKAIQAYAETGNAPAGLWIMLHTWAQAAALTPLDPAEAMAWGKACKLCGLTTEGMPARLQGLDHLLETIEEEVEEMIIAN
jgi:hypothetical protein